MTRRLFGLAALWLVTSVTVAGADFWESKSFAIWSDKEIEKVLTDSPWAQVVDAPVNADAARAGRGVPAFHLTITWETALPIRQAGARRTAGPGGVIPASIQTALEQAPPMASVVPYTVTIRGIPEGFSRPFELGVNTGNTRANTVLRRPDKPNLAATSVLLERDGELLRLRCLFPRTNPIAVNEKEIELVSTTGSIVIRKKFTLKEMVFHGRLEM